MIYRHYSRAAGEWRPNVHGGHENLETIGFLQRMNEELGADARHVLTIAKESTSWPGVSQPTTGGGLGFHYKWNMGWMNDVLRYFARHPLYRSHHQNELTFGLLYAFNEHFILPLSHDEVVHGKGSLLGKMPGDRWQRFANLRLLLAFMYAHPDLLDEPAHRGIQHLVRELNRVYRALPALHASDSEAGGFEWLSHDQHDLSVLAFMRHGHEAAQRVIVICNLTLVVRHAYRLGVPAEGAWRECLNSDSGHFGGSNVGNHSARLQAEPYAAQGRPASLLLDLPPLAAIYLQWTPDL